MLLVLSGSKPWNSDYCHPSGQVLYRVESPYAFTNRKATIMKVVPSEDGSLQDRFTAIAEIEFHTFTSSTITITGQGTYDTKSFFRKGGLSWNGRDRIFTAPDGLEYCWKMGGRKVELYRNNPAKTLIAKYHLKHYGILREARPASLEIFEEGQGVVDTILTTFVYVEKLRKDREQRSRNSGGGGGGGGGGG
ncbi:hypothetical protein CC1G_04883 [Coprinopsis cinerea okayama7|uniref:DUF6593 domain-containing protein n=1 Tax=Coprinopsis cinerea (strain Okayama-7 / 130 / ATCC MYA-4618 / FGSC 9003) TaxID=240176 RepID=A8PFX4_COPC7|nr:hypothetical protein CC1G_04883 [Coprinopsis cinerea okayama7\|eukprot:XP_001841039.2 hypothetical protein CC1G_04883 [Coprinopsis cinerea okayama7\